MTLDMLNYAVAWPEIFMLIMACVILIADVFTPDENRQSTYHLSQLTLVVTLMLISWSATGQREYAFHGAFVSDQLSVVLKFSIVAIVAIVFVYSREYLQQRNIFKGEFYVLGLFGALGMMIMVSASHFLSLYLGLELLSLALYSMVAFDRDNPNASEAAMKYFILGAIASGMLLYGISMIYGATESLDLRQVTLAVAQPDSMNIVLVFGLVFMVIGLAFKLGAVPFHMWIPDVYHGAPTAVTTFIASAPKIAGFAIAIRLLVEGMGPLHADWRDMLVILAILSMALGNIVAIAQSNLKRMLAYSTISHVGFILLGLSAGNVDGYSAAMFYTLTYALMSLGAFGMIILLTRAGFEAENIDDFKGLNQRSPWFAFMMLILMFSMAGVPPTVGFWAKLTVLKAVVHIDMLWLALVAVFFSIIGVYYYLRMVKVMYFDQAVDTLPLNKSGDLQVVLSANGLVILVLGVYPGILMALCVSVFT